MTNTCSASDLVGYGGTFEYRLEPPAIVALTVEFVYKTDLFQLLAELKICPCVRWQELAIDITVLVLYRNDVRRTATALNDTSRSST